MPTNQKTIMRDWLEKKSFKAALVVALIIVWGYNSYSIVGITNENETSNNQNKELSVDISELKIPETEGYEYSSDFRDPFKPGLRKKVRETSTKTQQQSKEEKVRIPNLRLTGVIEKMALIQNQQQLFFVSVGDTVEGARIRFVTEDSVGLVLKKKKFSLELNN